MMVFSQWPSPAFSWSDLLSWCSFPNKLLRKERCLHYNVLMALGSAAFQVCQVSPAQRKKWTPAITCLPQWTTIFSGSLEEKDLVSLLLPLLFDAQTPAGHGQEGCLLRDLPAAQVSAGGSCAPSLCPIPQGKPEVHSCSLLHWASSLGEGKRHQMTKTSGKPFFFSFCFWNPQSVSETTLPTQPLPVGKQV